MKRHSILLITLAFLLIPTVASATDWSTALPGESVRTYVPSQQTRVLIVSADAPEAADTLAQTLTDAAVVVPGSALGNVSELSDSDIIARASSQPVDQVMIVRLAGNPQSPTAVVTIYDLEGTSLGGFTASELEPAPASDGGGASQSELASAADESKSANQSGSREEFLDNYVSFDDWVGINQYGAVVSTWTVPYKGQYKEPLRGATFYEHIEQPDLAKKFRKRNTTRWIIAGSSMAVMIGGTIYSVSSISGAATATEFNATPLFVGLGASLIGSLGMVIGFAINPHPVEPSEARRLAKKFNDRLADRHGVDIESFGPQSQRSNPLDTLEVGVTPVKGGAMAGVSIRF